MEQGAGMPGIRDWGLGTGDGVWDRRSRSFEGLAACLHACESRVPGFRRCLDLKCIGEAGLSIDEYFIMRFGRVW